MEFIDSILAQLNSVLSGPALGGIAIALEFILRLLPTEKPKSILLAVGGILKGVAAVFSTAAAILDKVVPQRLK